MPKKKRHNNFDNIETLDWNKKYEFSDNKLENSPVQRSQANARERARMRILSSAFGRLKARLPNIPSDTKLSKLDTLRLAVNYIQLLKAIVNGENSYMNPAVFCSQQHNGTWPFILPPICSNYIIANDDANCCLSMSEYQS